MRIDKRSFFGSAVASQFFLRSVDGGLCFVLYCFHRIINTGVFPMKRTFCYLLVLVLLLGTAVPCSADAVPPSSADSAPHKSTSKPTAEPAPPAPSPYDAENGEVFVEPDYDGSCEVKVIVDQETDCYVYLEYLGESESSLSSRELKSDAEAPYESDLAFYVKAGEKVTKKIPVGIYKLYYATGTVFYGKDDLFGDESRCYSADELLDFYTDENKYYIQYTIKFFRPSDTYYSDVPYEEFPTGHTEP